MGDLAAELVGVSDLVTEQERNEERPKGRKEAF